MGYYRRQQFRKQSEATEQERVIAWAAWNERQHPELKMLYHIPNGGSRNELEAANLKRQGVKAGVPDLCLPVARCGFHGLYIEMKFGKNKLTQKQESWLEELRQQNYKAVVCYGADAAIRELELYLDKWENMPCPYEADGRERLNYCRTFDDCTKCKMNWERSEGTESGIENSNEGGK